MTKSLLFTWSTLAVCVLLSACESGDHIRIIDRSETPGGTVYANGQGPADSVVGEPTPRIDGCAEDAPLAANFVRVWPAAGQSIFLAKIQGSNSGPTTDFVDLTTIVTEKPGQWEEIAFANTVRYRYLRYYSASTDQAGLAELQFYYGTRRITGKAFGTVVEGSSYNNAFDGDATTFFAPTTAGGGYVGLDIGAESVAKRVAFSPPDPTSTVPFDLTLSSSTPNALIHYTLNGDEPTGDLGTPYTGPIHLDYGTWQVRAGAFADCLFDSPSSSVTYNVDPNAKPNTAGLKTYHLGNSLTDTINHWLKPIADSTGVNHTYARWTIPGAPIKWLFEHKGDGFADPDGANAFDTFVASYAPIDHMSIQPYADPDWTLQGPPAVSLLNAALLHSPDIQFWIYAQWPGQTEWTTGAFSNGGGKVFKPWQVAHKPTTWEEATQNELLYHEAFRAQIQALVAGKPILIIPGGLALVELKRQFDAGLIPGQSGDFFATFFEDEVHILPAAQYLVSLVFYACLYKLTPEGRVTHEGTGLTDEQALIYQRIAWDVASNYASSGI